MHTTNSRWRGLASLSAIVLGTCGAVILLLAWAARQEACQRWLFGKPLNDPTLFWPSTGLPTDIHEKRPERLPYVVPIGGSTTGTAFRQPADDLAGHLSRTTIISISFQNQVALVRLLCQRWELATRAPGTVMVFGVALLPTASTKASQMEFNDKLVRQRFTENGLYRYSSDRILRPVCPEFLRPVWIETFLRARRFSQLVRKRLQEGPQKVGESFDLLFAAPRQGQAAPDPDIVTKLMGPDPEPLPAERAALRACIDLAQTHRARPVLLHLPLPERVRQLGAVQRTRAFCQQLAAETGADYWDYTDLLPDSAFSDMAGHHGPEGQREIARVILRRVEALLPPGHPTPGDHGTR
jgi:hypothetical protein